MWRDLRVALVAAVAVGLWIPLTHVQWFASHEHIEYILRSLQWAGELRRGRLYPRWCPDFYGGFGSAMFDFYAPVPYATAALFEATFLDPFTSLKILILIISLTSGLGMYALVFGETRQRDAALLAAMAFLCTPYRIMNVFERGDLGEALCLGFIPISMALYRAVAHEARPQRARVLAGVAAAFHALVIMAHPILGLWATALVGVVVAASALGLARRRLWRRAVLVIAALAGAVGLAAVYVIPAISYRSVANTAAMIVDFSDPRTQWIYLRTLFEDNVPGTRLPGRFYQMGPILIATPIVVAIGCLRGWRRAWRALPWLAGTVLLVYLMLPQATWFWAPHRIPFVVYTQFPWRLIGLAAVTAAMALGIGAAAAFTRLPEAAGTWISFVCGAALVLGLAWPYVGVREQATARVPADPESIRQKNLSATNADEYLPAAVGKPPKQPPRDLVLSARDAAAEHVFSDGAAHALALRASEDGATVTLALHGFPGWKVATDAGPAEARLDADAGGHLRLTLPARGVYHVRVWFGVARAALAGGILSALSALALVLLAVRGTRLWPLPVPRAELLPAPAPVAEAAA
jgi:hypothetical protein